MCEAFNKRRYGTSSVLHYRTHKSGPGQARFTMLKEFIPSNKSSY